VTAGADDTSRTQRVGESLNRQLEEAWCRICELRGGAKAYVYLTPGGRLLARSRPFDDEPQGVHVGTFGAEVRLTEFREAVFRGFERLRRSR
jgi:hypothetical protein